MFINVMDHISFIFYMVIITSMIVRLTPMATSKCSFPKKFEKYPRMLAVVVGRTTVVTKLVNTLPKTYSTTTPPFSSECILYLGFI